MAEDLKKALGEAARDLTTAIQQGSPLKGEQRMNAGVEMEKQLKRFAEVIADMAAEKMAEAGTQ